MMQLSTLSAQLGSALLEFAWDEWAQMGLLAPSGRDRQWAQDPEALLLLTLEVARDDPRLFDETLDWLVRNESLISLRRLRTLCTGPEDERLASAVIEWLVRQRRPHAATRELEWAAGEAEPLFRNADLPVLRPEPVFRAFGFTRPPVELSGKSREPNLEAPINFAFRLRQLLGIGARSEAIRYLLTADIDAASVSDIAASSGYSKRNIQEALTSLGAAGAAKVASSSGEQRFAVDRARWAHLLDLEPYELPGYRDWPTLLGALRTVLRWLRRTDLDEMSEYLRASEAADLLDMVRPQLSRAGVVMSGRLRGERSWSDLEETIEYALFWLAPGSTTIGRPAAFEIIARASEGYQWRLTTAGGRIVATSAENYASIDAARAAAQRVRSAPQRLAFRVLHDAETFRWSITAENGRLLATSAESCCP
jgi:uncharacterized protein YegP (UPF0339 family)